MEAFGELIDDVVELEVAHPEIVDKEDGGRGVGAGLEDAHADAPGRHVAASPVDGLSCAARHGRQAYQGREPSGRAERPLSALTGAGASRTGNVLSRSRRSSVLEIWSTREIIAEGVIDCNLLSGIHSRAWVGAAKALPPSWEEPLQRIPDDVLDRIETEHANGLSSAEILDIFASHGVKFSEATLRKYVQLGLLPRSVRVGRKGKHQGSQGMYPASVVRQIQRIKEMMAQDYTIEEIQREFLFVRGDIEELERTLGKIFETLKGAAKQRRSEISGRAIATDLTTAEGLARELLGKLSMIEERLMAQARLSKQATG